jgi:peptidoglycan/xylan/chitin deacetylase (PgdA/CDA1 family)
MLGILAKNLVHQRRPLQGDERKEAQSSMQPLERAEKTPFMNLAYHEVTSQDSAYLYSVTSSQFDAHLDLVDQVSREGVPGFPQPLVTFDDGHISNFDCAVPILEKHRISAIFFVTTEWIGKRQEFMSWAQLREILSLGHSVQSHGATHRLLTSCSPAVLLEEVQRSKKVIEDALGIGVASISIPGGRWNSRVLEACQKSAYSHVYTSDPTVQKRLLAGVEVHGRLMVHRTMTPAKLRPYLFEDASALRALRLKNSCKTICRRLVGDRFYARLWRVLAAKDQASYE